MGEYGYTSVDRENVEDVILYDIASDEACRYKNRVTALQNSYWPKLEESWKQGDRAYWKSLFDEEQYNAFTQYVENCLEDPQRFYNPFTLRITERFVEQHRRDAIETLAPSLPSGRYMVDDDLRIRKQLSPLPESPPDCETPTELEWVCRLTATLHHDCPRLPSVFKIEYADSEPSFKFADFVTTIRDGRLAVVEVTMRSKQFSQKLDQLSDYAWLVEYATGVEPESYMIQHGLVTEEMRNRFPSWCTGYYSVSGFSDFLDEVK